MNLWHLVSSFYTQLYNIMQKKPHCSCCINYLLLVYFSSFVAIQAKGQLISKWIFGVIKLLQKTNQRIRIYSYDSSGRRVLVRFLEEIDDPKKTISKLTDLKNFHATHLIKVCTKKRISEKY